MIKSVGWHGAPINPLHNSTALITSSGELYAATAMDFSGRDPAIYRSLGGLPPLLTAQYNSKWLQWYCMKGYLIQLWHYEKKLKLLIAIKWLIVVFNLLTVHVIPNWHEFLSVTQMKTLGRMAASINVHFYCIKKDVMKVVSDWVCQTLNILPNIGFVFHIWGSEQQKEVVNDVNV